MTVGQHRTRRVGVVVLLAASLAIAGCGGPNSIDDLVTHAQSAAESTGSSPGTAAAPAEAGIGTGPAAVPAGEPDPRTTAAENTTAAGTDPRTTPAENTTTAAGIDPPEGVRIAFAGDVHFAERTADRLAADPSTAFGVAAPGLAAADLTMVNLETAITTGGEPEPKSFTFRAPPSALTALRDAGVDVASMANNHAADYGPAGLQDSLTAIEQSGFPVIGIGATDDGARTPYLTTIRGLDLAIFAASAVHDRTLAVWTATADSPGIASAFDPRLAQAVSAAATSGRTVIVFLHWGTEYDSCPDADQEDLAEVFAAAGASAVIGAHAHVLQGAGWRSDGVYVAYGLSNYLWWRSFGNEQDDNGVLTLTFDGTRVVAADFVPSHLDDTGVPVPATGRQADRINAQWEQVRECAGLSMQPAG